MGSLIQNLLEGSIVVGVVGAFALIYYAKFTNQKFGDVIKSIFSTQLFITPEKKPKPTDNGEVNQIWQENRTRM